MGARTSTYTPPLSGASAAQARFLSLVITVCPPWRSDRAAAGWLACILVIARSILGNSPTLSLLAFDFGLHHISACTSFFARSNQASRCLPLIALVCFLQLASSHTARPHSEPHRSCCRCRRSPGSRLVLLHTILDHTPNLQPLKRPQAPWSSVFNNLHLNPAPAPPPLLASHPNQSDLSLCVV